MGSNQSDSWLEVQQIVMESIKGKPLTGVSQADLDRALGETQTLSTTEPSGPVGKPTVVQSYPAGYESEV